MQHNRSTFSILFYINRGKAKKSGKCPIVGRISIDGENTAFSTGIDILPSDCILNQPLKVVEINKSAIDFVMLLSGFFAQFRAVKNNFNQIYRSLAVNFGEQKALKMIQIIAQSTREFGLQKQEIEEITMKLRAQIFDS